MTTKEIAQKLTTLCKDGQFEIAQKELFSSDAVSIEPSAGQGFAKETKGLDAIIKKGEQWKAMVAESHGIDVSDAVVAGNSFALTMKMDVTMKQGGRMDMTELCLYKVKDGKIVSEEFFM